MVGIFMLGCQEPSTSFVLEITNASADTAYTAIFDQSWLPLILWAPRHQNPIPPHTTRVFEAEEIAFFSDSAAIVVYWWWLAFQDPDSVARDLSQMLIPEDDIHRRHTLTIRHP